MPEIILAGEDYTPNESEIISLREAIRKGILKSTGRRLGIQTALRRCSPKHGVHPAGTDGPRLVLRSFRRGQLVVTTLQWIAAFKAKRVEMELAGKVEFVVPNERSSEKAEKAAQKAMDRLTKRGY